VRLLPCLLLLAWAAAYTGTAQAAGGPFGIDHEWRYDQTGIWGRNEQLGLEYGVIVTEGIGALWLGNDDPLGHTFWQSIDATAMSGVTAQLMKYAFSRARPYQGDNPSLWFQGSGHESFPSGEVTLQASFVAPFIVDYAPQHPWVWALEVLPLYDGIARMKAQAHWQSDVLVGWILGSSFGYLSTTYKTPLVVRILPRGLTVGFSKRF
jgi:membrane-associated phospholipid phosphatase